MYLLIFLLTLLSKSQLSTGNQLELNFYKILAEPLRYINNITTSDAIDKINGVFTQMEQILALYLTYNDKHPLLYNGCSLFVLHSMNSYKLFNVTKLFIKNIILPFLDGKSSVATRFFMLDYLDAFFDVLSSIFMKNIALKLYQPFLNAFHSNFQYDLVNLTFPLVCRPYITKIVADISGALLILSDDVILPNFSHNKYKKIALCRIIGFHLLKDMTYNSNVTNIYDFFKLADFLLLEIYKLTISPSIIWTEFSKYLYNILYSATFMVGYAYPALFIFGLVCNIFALLFTVSTFKLSCFNIYLLVLAVSDTCAIIGNLLPESVKFWYHYLTTKHCFSTKLTCLNPSYMADIYEISKFSCKLSHFLISYCRAASAWLMVSTAFVRLMAVYRPFQWRNKTIRFNVKVIIIALLSTAVFNATPLLTRHFIVYHFHNYQIRYCYQKDVHFVTYQVELYFTSLVFPILPMCLLLLFNVLTLHKMRRKSTLEYLTSIKKSDRRSTIVLLTVSFTFIFFTAPYFVNTLLQLYSKYDFQVAYSGLKYGTGPLLNLESYFFTFILSISNAINLFLYLLSSKSWKRKFYADMKTVIMCKRENPKSK